VKLSVSNIAWDRKDDNKVFPFLRSMGISGVEIAPTKIAPWQYWHNLYCEAADGYFITLKEHELHVSGIQSMHYGLDDTYSLVGDEKSFHNFLTHTAMVANASRWLEYGQRRILVYGSPSTRKSEFPDYQLLLSRMRLIDSVAMCSGSFFNVDFCIEACPAEYGGASAFLKKTSDAVKFVDDTKCSSIHVLVDTGCTWLGGEELEDILLSDTLDLVHFHASEPRLSPICDVRHKRAAEILRTCYDYSGHIVLEQRETPLDDFKRSVEKFVEFYGE
jgi:D-psicose/D-tagatose/L-ribulose 3-epimerase